MERLMDALSSNRLFKIIIADNKPFFVSQVLLEQTSEYFKGALRNQHLGDGERDTLKFPEDDYAAWQVLLYWIVKRELPSRDDLGLKDDEKDDEKDYSEKNDNRQSYRLLCIRCWILGDKYGIPRFQDLVMLELLDSLERGYIVLTAAREAVEHTPPGCVMRLLIAEEVVLKLSTYSMKYSDLNIFDGMLGFTAELLEKVEIRAGVDLSETDFLPRVPDTHGDYREGISPFCNFMLGEGPKQHWLHERLAKACTAADQG